MDANDEKLINKQLALLHDSNAVAQHALKNQSKIINSAIAQLIDNLEKKL